MSVLYWVCILLLAIGLAYVTTFSGATLMLGKELSETDSDTGYQNSLTPPWETNLALCIYVAIVAALGIGWWRYGFFVALGGLALTFIGILVARQFLPRADSDHFKTLMLRSMSRRYADFVKTGDSVRAQAMEGLLRKLGYEPSTYAKLT